MRSIRVIAVGIALCIAVGCNGEGTTFETVNGSMGGGAPVEMEPVQFAYTASPLLGDQGGAMIGFRELQKATPAVTPPNAERKIIYNATVDVVVEDIQSSNDKVRALVKTHRGYIANSDITGSAGSVRTSRWTLRIPADRFDAFLQEVQTLGEVTKNSRDSKDVTEEFYDIEARIKNKKVEEDRLLKHLEKSTATLKDTLDVERELSRVRGEIEQMQGRMNYLTNMTALTTVTVILHERKTYVPPTAPEFTTTAGRTWDRSLTSLVDFGKGIALFCVALTPWLPLIAVVAVPVFLLLRRARRARRLTVEVVHAEPT